MSGLTLTLKTQLNQRLDLSGLIPEKLARLNEGAIAALPLSTTRAKLSLGDAFRISMGDAGHIRIIGATSRLDNIGQGMGGGAISVEGDAGAYAGCAMTGGTLAIKGAAGPWAGAGMTGGRIAIGGDAGESAGGALPGAATGMRGGVIAIKGAAGPRAGDRMRRGLLIIEGKAGRYLGARLIAGTIAAMGGAGDYPGYLMRRGTIILDGAAGEISPSFADCGRQELAYLRLLAREMQNSGLSAPSAQRMIAPLRRYAGDMAALGKGEILHIEP